MSTATLQSWRTDPVRNRRFGLKLALTGLLLTCVTAFAVILWLPYSRPNLQFLILSPSNQGLITLENLPTADLSNLMARANAAHVAEQMKQLQLPIAWKQNSSTALPRVAKELEVDLASTVLPDATLVVYVSGVLAVDRLEPSLCDTERDATLTGSSLEILRLIRILQSLRCKHVLLCIDAVTPTSDRVQQIASSVAWKNFAKVIEKRLNQAVGTPISVQLGLSAVDCSEPATATSSLSSAFASAFENISNVGVSLAELQTQLGQTEHSRNEQSRSTHSSHNLVSANWPLDCQSYVFPCLLTKPKSTERVEDKQGSGFGKQKGADLPTATSDRQAYLTFCAKIFSAWKIPRSGVFPSQLQYPPVRSRRDTSPFVYYSLHDAFESLRTANTLMPDQIDNLQLETFADCVRRIDLGESLPDAAPAWIKCLSRSVPSDVSKPSSSLVTNSLLAQLDVLTLPIDDSGNQLLRELAEFASMTSPTTVIAFAEWLQRTPDAHQNALEVKWCKSVLTKPEAPWETICLLIQAKLLSTRVASDPLTARACDECLRAGDANRIRAERMQLDRPQPDWAIECDRLARSAINSYQECLVELERLRAAQDAYNSKLTGTAFESDRFKPNFARASDATMRLQAMVSICRHWSDALSPWNTAQSQEWLSYAARLEDEVAAHGQSIESQFKSIADLNDFVHSQSDVLFNWVPKHAGTVPRDSHFWVFLKRRWKSKAENLTDLLQRSTEGLQEVAQLNVDRISQEKQGATAVECAGLDEQRDWWELLAANQSQNSGALRQPTLSIRADATLDLISREEIETNFEIQSSATDDRSIEVEAIFDNRTVDVEINGATVASGRPITVYAEGQIESTTTVPMLVRRRCEQMSKQPIVLIARRNRDQRRALIHLTSPSDPIVEIHFVNRRFTTDSMPLTNLSGQSAVMLPNQPNELSIAVRNLQGEASTYLARIYSVADAQAEPPFGSVSVEHAKLWLSSVGATQPLASSNALHLAKGQCDFLGFLPAPWHADQPRPVIQKFVVEITNESENTVQFAPWTPGVVHPQQYLQATVRYDSEHKTITVHSRATAAHAISPQGTPIEIEMFELNGLRPIARAMTSLYPTQLETENSLTTAGCQAERVLLSISVDRWQSSFIYELDLKRSGVYEVSKKSASLQIKLAQPSQVIAADATEVEFQVDAMINDDSFDFSRDRIKVGFDQNGNRSLADDITLQLHGTKNVQFAWMGVNAEGALAIQSSVESHRVKLPVAFEWNRWLTSLAELHRPTDVVHSNSVQMVFDRTPPRIESLRVVGPIPCLTPKPISIEVHVNDDGLSGVNSVEGAWSTTGEIAFTDQMKIVPAIYRDADRWLLTLPTDSMPSGNSLLVVRARDLAGSMSKTYSVTVDLLTQEELAARNARFTTTISGDVHYSRKPNKGMSIRLLENATDPKTPAGTEKVLAEAATAKLVASSTTDELGRFVLNAVPSGTYDLELTGIVRGMRVKRNQQIIIVPQSAPSEVHFRLDQKQ